MGLENSKTLTLAEWKSRAAELKIETGLFINGTYTDAKSGARFDSINPATGKIVASVSCGDEDDIDRAVASAKSAWKEGSWRFMDPRDRMAVLIQLAELIGENSEELALLECLDMGKPITDVLTIDLPEVIVSFRYFAECIDKISGSVTNTAADALHMILKEPLGIVGAISAWNYPMLMAVWKVAPALAAGNCVVLKPSERAPLSCLKLAELFISAGGPPGVFNVVNGMGHVAGKALALHPDVAKISFTGSTATGKLIMTYAGQSNLKRVALETGGKSPQIFMSDLEDLDKAVDYAIGGIFDNAGQVCNAGSRLLVHRDIQDAFIRKFIEKSKRAYQPGDPLNPQTTLGPLVTKAHQQDVLDKIARGVAEGAELLIGGHIPEGMEQGTYVQPALFNNADNRMSISREEVFGPVATIIPFQSEEEAIAIANDSDFGLAASVWTRDLNRAHRMVKAVEAGVLWVNCFGDGDMTQPFGGYKQSGNTRDKSIECLLGYTQSKSAWINLGS
ncbi:MAG: aldehyde dehydrogenase [Sneathiella sp.]|nr:aldehyde dehydrogenase [Sneathiella sp.]